MGKDKKDKFKLSEQDRASLAASSFNAAALLVSQSDTELEDAAEAVLSLNETLFELRVDWMEGEKIGNPKVKDGGGSSSKPSQSSRGSSGGARSGRAGNATDKQRGFYGELITSIKEEDGEAALDIKEFSALSVGEASDAIEVAKDLRDELQE